MAVFIVVLFGILKVLAYYIMDVLKAKLFFFQSTTNNLSHYDDLMLDLKSVRDENESFFTRT